MGNFVYSVHNSKDDKLYNILGRGELPTVVFGRVIRPNSVPGMMYYFADGRVKYKVNGGWCGGWDFVIPFLDEERTGDAGNPRQIPCIFTIPENFEFSKMSDIDYVIENSKTATRLNANTMSPYFKIRNGEIICIKEIPIRNRYMINKVTKQINGIGKCIYRYLKEIGRIRRENRDGITKYRMINKKKIHRVIHNQFEIIPTIKRNRTKTYKSINRYPAFRRRRNFSYRRNWNVVELGNMKNVLY